MTTYCTRQDIEAIYGAPYLLSILPELPELPEVEDSEDPPPLDPATDPDLIVQRAITAASSEIESYIAQRVTLPIPSVPDFLRTIAVDIAVYRICNTHDRLTEEVTKRYERAVHHLRDIARGVASLGPAEIKPVSGATFFSAPKRFR